MTTTEKPKLSPDEIINKINDVSPEEQSKKLKEFLINYTIDDLYNLAEKINANKDLEKNEKTLEKYKKGMRDRIKELKLEKGFAERLTILNTKTEKCELQALLPELKPKEIAKPKGMLEKGSGYAIGAFNSVIGWFKGAGGWIGGAATYAYNYLANPENRAKLVRTIGNLAKSGWYHLLKAPALVGIPPTFPGLGKIAAGADEKLKQMDAIDTIYEIVETENENPDTPPVKFDGKMNKTVWMRWKPEERTPEAIQKMTLAYIDAQRDAGNKSIVVTISELKNPEAAAKSASETLLKTLATNLGVSKVAFGEMASAKKESNGWSITILESDVNKTDKQLKPNSPADKLVKAAKTMTTVSEITIDTSEEILIKKDGGITKVVSSIANLEAKTSNINNLANKIPGGRVTTLKLGDKTMKTDKPRAVFFAQNQMISTNATGAEHVESILSDKIAAANDKQKWMWDGNKWIDETQSKT